MGPCASARILLAAVVIVAACSESKRRCDPGATRRCAGCSSELAGAQICAPDGLGWGRCDCGAEPSSGLRYRTTVAFPSLPASVKPVDLQDPGDRSDQLFVAEAAGRVYRFERDRDASVRTLVLDITSKVDTSDEEQGLLGLAFHPRFAENGFMFVFYADRDTPSRAVVARYAVNAATGVASPVEKRVIVIDKPKSRHNGGQIGFGADRMFYISVGDGRAPAEAQNRASLAGAMLRIDVDEPVADRGYRIPADNPLVGKNRGERAEIWAWGLRNPWRWSFDRPTKRLWLGDVGEDHWEEINIIEKGRNYGWNVTEGRACRLENVFPPQRRRECARGGLTDPVHQYKNPDWASIIGGYVYRGKRLPGLVGKYIYAEFVSGEIWALDYARGRVAGNALIADSNLFVSSFGTDRDGRLYLLSYYDGRIYRLERR